MNRLNILHYFLTIVIFCTIITISCKEKGTEPVDPDDLPSSNLTYVDDMDEFFEFYCATAPGCHSFSDHAGELDLTDHGAILQHQVEEIYPLVISGNGEGSILYQILNSDLFINNTTIPRMPPNGPYLNQNNKNGVKVWIDEGLKYSNDS